MADPAGIIDDHGLAPALAVTLDQLFELSEVVNDVNPTSAVKLGGLQQPQVETGEVTERHRVPKEVLFQCPLLLVECLFLLFNMLFDEASPVVVEVLENKGLLVRVRPLAHLRHTYTRIVGTLTGTRPTRANVDYPFELLLALSVLMWRRRSCRK